MQSGPTAGAPLLSAEDVRRQFGALVVLDGVAIEVANLEDAHAALPR